MQEKTNWTISEDGMTLISSAGNKVNYFIVEGKYRVNLNAFGSIKNYIVARLVYWYFNPLWNIKSKQVIQYKDGNPLNIHINNLYLANKTDIYKHKLTKKQEESLFKDHYDKNISIKDLAIKYNVSKSMIVKLLKRLK